MYSQKIQIRTKMHKIDSLFLYKTLNTKYNQILNHPHFLNNTKCCPS